MFESTSRGRSGEPVVDVRVPGPRPVSPVERWVGSAVAGVREREGALLAGLGAAPSPALVGALLGLAPAGASDGALVEGVAGWERVVAWAVSRQAVLVNELRRRRDAQRQGEFLGDEVAARLGTTRAAGARLVGEALGLEQLPQVWDALDAGSIDARKASVLCEELLALPWPLRFDVAEEVVALGPVRTAAQLRARIRRRALAADPAAASRAHARERAARFVSVEPVRDGMAWLHAFLPAADAVAVHTALTAMADAQGPEDRRGVDARRADALVDVVTRWLDAGTTPDGRPLPTRHRRRPHLQVTVAATTLAGLDQAPAELAGYGPITADVARDLARRASWQVLTVDPRTGETRPTGAAGTVGATSPARAAGADPPPAPLGYRPPQWLTDRVMSRDVTCTFPGCRVQAARCDLDHIDPFDPRRPADEQTVEPNLHALCRHHHRLKTHGDWHARRDDTTGTTVWDAPTGHRYLRPPEPPTASGTHHGALRSGTPAQAQTAGPTPTPPPDPPTDRPPPF